MAREIVEPVTETDDSPMGGTVSTHPAFAQIAVHRVTGRTNLYDSDFGHNAFVTISIRRSELRRSLNQDWHMADKELVEVAMSESQWATFVSSINMGSGVPCTLQALDGKQVPGLPAPERRVDQFSEEMRTRMKDAFAALEEAQEALDAVRAPKAQRERVADAIDKARRQMGSNFPYMARQFAAHMADTVERAKQEVHGYMTGALQRAGLAALKDGQAPLQVEDESDSNTAET